MNSKLVIISSALFLMGTAGCAGQWDSESEISEKTSRIESLEKRLDETQAQFSAEETKRIEAEKHQSRMLRCHRDFRGSYGVLVEKQVRLVRETGRLIYKNVEGTVTLDTTETLSPPREVLSLPELKFLSATYAQVLVLNRQTCEGGGFYKGLTRFNAPNLWIDRANATLTHEVYPGLNQIDFGVCDDSGRTEGVSKDCSEPTWVATLNLNVDYEEIESGAVREVISLPKTEKPGPEQPVIPAESQPTE